MTKSGMGTWEARTRGRGDVGLGDAGTRAAGMRGRGDVGTWDSKTSGLGMWDVGTRGRDKQTTPDFCAELKSSIFSALEIL